MLIEVDADGKGPDRRDLATAVDVAVFSINQGLQTAIDCLEEIRAVIAEVESEQVVAQHSIEKLFFPGEDAKGFPVRPGNVPKLRDHKVRVTILQHAWQ